MNPQPMIDYHNAAMEEAIGLHCERNPGVIEPGWDDTERLQRVIRVLDERYGIWRWDAFAHYHAPIVRPYLRPEAA